MNGEDAEVTRSDTARPQSKAASFSLNRLQRWMQAVIMAPEGTEAGIASDAARQLLDVEPAHLEKVIERSRQCSSLQRLSIYNNAYYARLIDCLESEFPALQRLVGDELFDSFAIAYLQAHPSSSYTLGNLGAKFPQFLRDTRPEDVEHPGWPDLLIDLATLERCYGEVFDGPGPEGDLMLQPEDLQAIPPDRFGDLVLTPSPALRLLSFDFPVHEYKSAMSYAEEDSEEEIPPPDPEPTWLAVNRVRYMVRRWPLTQAEFALLSGIVSGLPLGTAIEQAIPENAQEAEEFAGTLHEMFEEWTAAAFFSAATLS